MPPGSNYNFEKASDGSCKLVPGLSPLDPVEMCAQDPKKVSYFASTPYRKIPLSECIGGTNYDNANGRLPCPGHESEFNQQTRGLSGFALFLLAFCLPALLASAVGYWVWRNWEGKFGRIQLGTAADSSRRGAGSDNPWIAYPVMLVSGVVAVVAALPLLAGGVWRSITSLWGGGSRDPARYTTRGSFARGRGDYAVVDPDEDELLGDDDDEEV